MIVRYISIQVIFLLAYITGLIIYPIVFILRKPIRKYNVIPLWWFLNDSESSRDSDDFGAEWWRNVNGYTEPIINYSFIKKFYISYRWSAIRNSHWNLKLKLTPKTGVAEDVNIIINTTDKNGTMFCNYNILGSQYCTFKIKGTKYFRYSFSKVYFNKILWNMQIGSSQIRYIFKNRIKWL